MTDCTTTPVNDLNGDGINDGYEWSCVTSYPRWPIDSSETHYLRPSPGNTVLSTAAPLQLGDWIPAPHDPLAGWQSDGVLLLSVGPGAPPSGLLANTNTTYIGVRFQTAQGLRIGWVKVGENPDSGWQPQADSPMRVGDQSGPPPVTESESRVPVHLGPSPIADFVVVVRAWSNLVSREVGVSATLKNWVSGTTSSDYEIVAEPGAAGGQTVWLGYPLRVGTRFPAAPTSPAQWVAASEGIVLSDSRSRPGVTEPVTVGPLARKASVTIGLRRPGGASRPGWMRLDRQYRVEAACPEMADLTEQVIGEPNPVHDSTLPTTTDDWTRHRLDLDGDGVIECLVRTHSSRNYDERLGEICSHERDDLLPLGETAVLTGPPFRSGEPIEFESAGPRAWQNSPMLLYSARGGMACTPPERYRWTAPIGLRFEGADGTYVGWLDYGRESVPVVAFEPGPGRPIEAGSIPTSLHARRFENGVKLSWNVALTDCALEASPVVPAAAWSAVAAATPGQAVVPRDEVCRFFRLGTRIGHEDLWRVLRGCPGPVSTLGFTADGTALVVGGGGAARLWRLGDGHFVKSFDQGDPAEWMWSGGVAPQAAFLLTCTDRLEGGFPPGLRRLLRLWRVDEGQLTAELPVSADGPPGWLAVSPDGRLLLVDGELWDARESRSLRTLASGARGTFSPDGTLVVTWRDYDLGALLWRVSDGTLQAGCTGHGGGVVAASFSLDGTQVITASRDRTARLWRVHDGSSLRTFAGHFDEVLAVALSPGGRWLLTGSKDKTALLWRTDDGRLIRQFQYATTAVTAVAFSPDGQLLALGTDNGLVRVYDISTLTTD